MKLYKRIRSGHYARVFVLPENLLDMVVLWRRGYRKSWIGHYWSKPNKRQKEREGEYE